VDHSQFNYDESTDVTLWEQLAHRFSYFRLDWNKCIDLCWGEVSDMENVRCHGTCKDCIQNAYK
jgi:hypothetical protein